jgi:hypothetical protein
MFSYFKKHFIPHIGNDHRPHFLRNKNIYNILILIIFLEIFTFLIPTLIHLNRTGGMAAVLPAVLSNLTNEERQNQKLPILIVNSLLTKAAESKAQDMATKSYFSHTSREGKTPWFWIDQVGYKYQYAGENLAINFNDSVDVTQAWMNSPTHRANIMKGKYTEIGTGIAVGIYEGRETVFVAQMYASPAKTIPVVNKKVVQNSSKVELPIVQNEKELIKILGEETEIISPTPQPTFIQKLLSSPHNTTNIIFYIIFGIIIFALILYIFIKIKNHHKDLITNGLIVIAILGAILVINNYISKHNMIVLDSVDYSVENL